MCVWNLSAPVPAALHISISALAECEVLHFATLLVFHNATGGVPFLPQPVLQPHEGGGDREESWSRELLSAVRGDISAETEQSLVSLQREIEVILLYVCIFASKECIAASASLVCHYQ